MLLSHIQSTYQRTNTKRRYLAHFSVLYLFFNVFSLLFYLVKVVIIFVSAVKQLKGSFFLQQQANFQIFLGKSGGGTQFTYVLIIDNVSLRNSNNINSNNNKLSNNFLNSSTGKHQDQMEFKAVG